MVQPFARSAPSSSRSAATCISWMVAQSRSTRANKAVNHREKNFTHDRLTRRMAAIDGTIERYLSELDRSDRQRDVTGVPVPAAKVARLKSGIETLKEKVLR